jgi:hypothetical protein
MPGSPLNLGFRGASRFFLDRPAVQRLMDRNTSRFMLRMGGFIRLTARRSIRRRKAASRPGTPPTDRTGKLKRGIYFGFNPARRSVVIGPTRSGGTVHGGRGPRALEEGGRLRDRDGRLRRYVPRPFMKPALDKGIDRRRAFWRQSVA